MCVIRGGGWGGPHCNGPQLQLRSAEERASRDKWDKYNRSKRLRPSLQRKRNYKHQKFVI